MDAPPRPQPSAASIAEQEERGWSMVMATFRVAP